MDDSLCANVSSRGRHSDPSIRVFFGDLKDRSVGLEVELACLQNNSQHGVDKLVRPAVRPLVSIGISPGLPSAVSTHT